MNDILINLIFTQYFPLHWYHLSFYFFKVVLFKCFRWTYYKQSFLTHSQKTTSFYVLVYISKAQQVLKGVAC